MESSDALSAGFVDALFDHAPVGLAILDRDLRFVRINRTLADINGSSIEDHLGRTASELFPNLPDEHLAAYQEVLTTREPVHSRRLVDEAGLSGGQRTWDVTIYPISLAGEVIGFGTSVIEVTELVDLERNLLAHGESIYGEIVQSLVIAKVGMEVGGHEPLVRLRVAQALSSAKHLTTELITGSLLEEVGN